jgi:uncharacterized protein YggT (Ycf19 family)
MDNKIKVPAYLSVGKVITYAMYAWIMFGIIVLGLRVFLLAFSANPNAGFTDFIYRTSASFLEPFRGIFPPKAVSETGYLDVAAIFAMIIYALIGWAFSGLIHYIQSKIDHYTAEARAAQRRREQAQIQNASSATRKTTANTRSNRSV